MFNKTYPLYSFNFESAVVGGKGQPFKPVILPKLSVTKLLGEDYVPVPFLQKGHILLMAMTVARPFNT